MYIIFWNSIWQTHLFPNMLLQKKNSVYQYNYISRIDSIPPRNKSIPYQNV